MKRNEIVSIHITRIVRVVWRWILRSAVLHRVKLSFVDKWLDLGLGELILIRLPPLEIYKSSKN